MESVMVTATVMVTAPAQQAFPHNLAHEAHHDALHVLVWGAEDENVLK